MESPSLITNWIIFCWLYSQGSVWFFTENTPLRHPTWDAPSCLFYKPFLFLGSNFKTQIFQSPSHSLLFGGGSYLKFRDWPFKQINDILQNANKKKLELVARPGGNACLCCDSTALGIWLCQSRQGRLSFWRLCRRRRLWGRWLGPAWWVGRSRVSIPRFQSFHWNLQGL